MPRSKKATVNEKYVSKDVLCPADLQINSGSGQILSGEVIDTTVTTQSLLLNLKLTSSELTPGAGPIFKAFVHKNIICTKVLAKILPAVIFKVREHGEEESDMVLQRDTLLSFSVVAREMTPLRSVAGLHLDTSRTINKKPGQCSGDGRLHETAKGDKQDDLEEVNKGNDSEESENIEENIADIVSPTEDLEKGTVEPDHDTVTDDADTKNDNTRQPCPIPAMHKCNVCVETFENESMLTKHQLTHGSLETRHMDHSDEKHRKLRYACSFGCRAFTTKSKLATHMMIHTRTRDHVCKICSRAFFDAGSLATHQFVHSDDKPYKCAHCSKEYTMHNTLKKHISKQHAELPPNTQQPSASRKHQLATKEHLAIHVRMNTGNGTIVENPVKPEYTGDACNRHTSIGSAMGDNHNSVEEIKGNHLKTSENIANHVDEDNSDCVTLIDKSNTEIDNTIKDPAMHKCNVCGETFENEFMLMRHQLSHEKRQYACSFGCRSFTSKSRLATHMTIHTRTRDHVCKICSRAFFDAGALETHQLVHSDDKPYKCKQCDKAYTMDNTLKRHVWKHHAKFRHYIRQPRGSQKHQLATQNRRYTCPFGCRSFTSKSRLAIHMTIHTRTRDHVCKICSRAFFNAGTLKSHQFVHSDEKPFKCTQCDKAYTLNSSLKKHSLVHRAEFRPYKCDICGKLSDLKRVHEGHLLTHTDEKAFQCEYCGKQFRRKDSLDAHEGMHKSCNKYKCDQCDKSYRHRYYLKVHKKTHTGENLLQCEACGDWFSDPKYFKRHQREYCKGKKDVQCEVCGQSFPNNYHLGMHMGLHSGERPFGCDVCGKAFTKPEALADHVKRHVTETDFQCQICGKFWISKSELGKHEVRHKQRKLHARLPEEMKPGRYHMLKPDQASGAESDTPIVKYTDTSGGPGHQQLASIDDGDQRPQSIVTYNVQDGVDQSMVIYVNDGVGGDQIPQSMTIYVDHPV